MGDKSKRGRYEPTDPNPDNVQLRTIYDDGRKAELQFPMDGSHGENPDFSTSKHPEQAKVNRVAKGDREDRPARGRPRAGTPRPDSPDRNKARGRY